MKNKVIKSLLVICLLFVGLIYFTNDKDIVRKVEGATTGIGTLDNPYIIDEESDFKLMNGSSSYFKMTNDIIISDLTTSLGIETFDGVFEGCGYSIKNLSGTFVKELTGEINNVVIDSPKTFVANMNVETKQISESSSRYAFLREQEDPNASTSMYGKPQYFGFVCGKVTDGSLNSVRVTNATIDTNSHTKNHPFGMDYTTAYVGFIASVVTDSYIYNCTVDNSTLIYSTGYAIGGLVGELRFSTLYGCLLRDLTVTGKNGVSINKMSKAYSGLIAGILDNARVYDIIAVDISQGSTPYLSMFGLIATRYLNVYSYNVISDIYYDDTVAPFSTNYHEDDQYELIYNRVSENTLEMQNSGCDAYGNVQDAENNNVDKTYFIKIKLINEYDSSVPLSSIIEIYNQTITQGSSYHLKRSTTTYLPAYVSQMDHKIKVDFSIDEITFGDKMKDKIHYEVDKENTNFDADLQFKYKPSGWNNYTTLDEDSYISEMSFDWYIIYQLNGNWYEVPNARGTVEVKPFDISKAEIRYNTLYKYSGYEQKNLVSAYTVESHYDLKFDITGTMSATEIGTYSFTLIGKENATGSITKTWSITAGEMRNIDVSHRTKIYNGKSQIFDVENTPEGSTIKYSTDGVNYYSDLGLKNAGEYNVYYKVSHPDFDDYIGQSRFTIEPLEIEVSWYNTELVYNGELQIPSYRIDNLVKGDVINVKLVGYKSDVSSSAHTAQISAIDNPNYMFYTRPQTGYWILPKPIDKPYESNTIVDSVEYNGKTQKAMITSGEGYGVYNNNGWINVGTYSFEISLYSKNYVWSDGTKNTIYCLFEITPTLNSWVVEPSIKGWVYNEAKRNVVYEALYGNLSTSYAPKDGSSERKWGLPSDAGEYEIYVEVKDSNCSNVLTATLDLVIEQADYDDPFYYTTARAKYGQTLADISLPTLGGKNEFVDDPTTFVGDAGENVFEARFVPYNANYKTIYYNITITVDKIAPTYKTPTTIKNLSYDKTPQELISVGSVSNEGLVMEYRLSTSEEWFTEIPTGIDAGKYIIYYRILGGNNYTDVSGVLSTEIAKVSVNPSFEIAPVHILDDKNKYEFEIISRSYDVESFDESDYEIVSIVLTDSNLIGERKVEVTINLLNKNYTVTKYQVEKVIINDHEQSEDDSDCQSAVLCKYCDYVFIEALTHNFTNDYVIEEDVHYHVCSNLGCEVNDGKIPHNIEDDKDCLTQLECVDCGYLKLEAKPEHADEDLDHTCDNETCEVSMGEHLDGEDNNHLCDYGCKVLADEGCYDENNDCICDECGLEMDHDLSELIYSHDSHWYECKNDSCEHIGEKTTHQYGEWEVTKEATKTEKGSKSKICECGHEVIEEIPVLTSGVGNGVAIIASIILILGGLFVLYWFVLRKKFL